jgi:plasmid maintenance system antidote protein VapI
MSKSTIAPIDPGEYLRELLDELGLSQYRLAQDIGVAPCALVMWSADSARSPRS